MSFFAYSNSRKVPVRGLAHEFLRPPQDIHRARLGAPKLNAATPAPNRECWQTSTPATFPTPMLAKCKSGSGTVTLPPASKGRPLQWERLVLDQATTFDELHH